ncbi:MAG: hypothetical protein Q8M03_07080 [Legionella sp.]|nr:hypothetical protein [Legionella sp.]
MNNQISELSIDELDVVVGGSLVGELLATAKLMHDTLSNVSTTRSEISMTFARNARA